MNGSSVRIGIIAIGVRRLVGHLVISHLRIVEVEEVLQWSGRSREHRNATWGPFIQGRSTPLHAFVATIALHHTTDRKKLDGDSPTAGYIWASFSFNTDAFSFQASTHLLLAEVVHTLWYGCWGCLFPSSHISIIPLRRIDRHLADFA